MFLIKLFEIDTFFEICSTLAKLCRYPTFGSDLPGGGPSVGEPVHPESADPSAQLESTSTRAQGTFHLRFLLVGERTG